MIITDRFKDFLTGVLATVIAVGVIGLGGYFWLVKENRLRIAYTAKDVFGIKDALESIKINQLSNKLNIERLFDEKEDMAGALKNTQRNIKVLTLAITKKFPDIDLKLLLLSLNDVLKELPAEQSAAITKEINKRLALVRDMDKHTLLERTKMSNNFFKAIEKYKLDPFTKEVIASRLFKVSYGVGGGEDVEDLAPYAP